MKGVPFTNRVPLRELHIDVQRIKPAVLKEVEQRIGRTLASLKTAQVDAEVLWALAYAYGRRLDPELTYEEAGELDVYLESATVPPTNAAG